MTPAYLSAETARWSPQGEWELRHALERGLLEETHFLDLKRELPTGRSTNKELAKDLASFAIDGGLLVLGVEERPDGQVALAPLEHSGIPERVEQVARTAIDPPLAVTCSVIPAEGNPTLGYVIVHVPVSGTAPHMVDGAYFGRGDKTKHKLSDSEVARLHALRIDTTNEVRALVANYVARDPVPADAREQAHLFLVAAPVSPRPEMLVEAIGGDRAFETVHRLVHIASSLGPLEQQFRFSPDVSVAGSFARRADGAAMAAGLDSDRTLQASPGGAHNESAFEVEISDEGIVRMMTTRFSSDIDGSQELFEDMLPVLVRRILAIAVGVSDSVGYNGLWMIGLEANGIAGLVAYGSRRGFGHHALSADQHVYRSEATASTAELAQAPGAVTGRLAGRYLRSLGLHRADRFLTLISDDAPEGSA
ncbi:AlbA family DNA-binding domain-containing protein [Terrabacter sp. RAF57]|uniref:AlbA family DNA-binding domain-containing protein n=1 Tax=Terrabacter sp. RAF57 TaxID=3233063 RepID=UPI003F992FE5